MTLDAPVTMNSWKSKYCPEGFFFIAVFPPLRRSIFTSGKGMGKTQLSQSAEIRFRRPQTGISNCSRERPRRRDVGICCTLHCLLSLFTRHRLKNAAETEDSKHSVFTVLHSNHRHNDTLIQSEWEQLPESLWARDGQLWSFSMPQGQIKLL